jgi:hypothetical protein
MKQTPTYRVTIFMAGDIAQAKQVCREYAFALGFCVHIFPVDYVYTGGEEAGFAVGIIDYPRFPQPREELFDRAADLANKLKQRCCQRSYSIVADDRTIWFSEGGDSSEKERQGKKGLLVPDAGGCDLCQA